MWILLHSVQLILKYENVCPSAKESEDKENLPKRTSAGGFKFTFSHSASAANGANGANSKSVAAQTSPASSNSSSSKNATLTTAVTATKVGELIQKLLSSPRAAQQYHETVLVLCYGQRWPLGRISSSHINTSEPCLDKPLRNLEEGLREVLGGTGD